MDARASENGFVSLLVVSDKASIAEGGAQPVAQVAGRSVPRQAIGGDTDGSLGTAGGRVLDAMRAAAAGSGAVVLMDLGSSVLAVRVAQEEMTPEELER